MARSPGGVVVRLLHFSKGECVVVSLLFLRVVEPLEEEHEDDDVEQVDVRHEESDLGTERPHNKNVARGISTTAIGICVARSVGARSDGNELTFFFSSRPNGCACRDKNTNHKSQRSSSVNAHSALFLQLTSNVEFLPFGKQSHAKSASSCSCIHVVAFGIRKKNGKLVNDRSSSHDTPKARRQSRTVTIAPSRATCECTRDERRQSFPKKDVLSPARPVTAASVNLTWRQHWVQQTTQNTSGRASNSDSCVRRSFKSTTQRLLQLFK